MTRVFVTGGDGMVGCELKKLYPDGLFTDLRGENPLDVSDARQVREKAASFKPDVIIHLAAATDVDWCEQHPEECRRVNVDTCRAVAEIACEQKIRFVYPSTFYVYPGEKNEPYDERFDEVIPEKIVGVYSKSKWEGEVLVSAMKGLDYLIVRFGSLFGGGKRDKKFVMKVIRMAREGQTEMKMVNDRLIQPSSVKDTVRNLQALIEKNARGVFNLVGKGQATYFEYAQAVLEFAGFKNVKVIPISSGQFKEASPRARNLIAVNGRLSEMGLDLMRDWRVALKEYIEEYREELLNG